MHSIKLNDIKFSSIAQKQSNISNFIWFSLIVMLTIKKFFCEMKLWVCVFCFFIAFFKIQRLVSLKTGLKTLAVSHSGHGWNSTNHSCLERLFSLDQEFSSLAVHWITLKNGEHLKDIDGPHPRLINQNFGSGVGSSRTHAQDFLFSRWQ